MALQHGVCGSFQFGGLPREVGAGAAFGFGGVAGELDAIDGEHLAPNQSLPITEVEYLGEDGCNIVTQ
jgi:hypothetical protein